MADWGPEQEAAHPRVPKGSHGGGEWASHVMARIMKDGRVVGQDLSDELDYGHLRSIHDQYQEEDHANEEIGRLQGFHGKPRVVSRQEMDKLVADGWTELHRGLRSHHQPEMVPVWAEQFRTGDRHFPGLGVYGNGTYTSADRERALRYTVVNDDPAAENPPGLLRMALNPDARVVTYSEIQTMMDADGLYGPYPDEGAAKAYVLHDEGRYAAAHGFDAIKVSAGASTTYVILNRTAVAVEEAQQ